MITTMVRFWLWYFVHCKMPINPIQELNQSEVRTLLRSILGFQDREESWKNFPVNVVKLPWQTTNPWENSFWASPAAAYRNMHEPEWFSPKPWKLWKYQCPPQKTLSSDREEFTGNWSAAGASLRGQRRSSQLDWHFPKLCNCGIFMEKSRNIGSTRDEKLSSLDLWMLHRIKKRSKRLISLSYPFFPRSPVKYPFGIFQTGDHQAVRRVISRSTRGDRPRWQFFRLHR